MKQIPIKEETIPTYSRKGIKLIVGLIIAGVLTGLVLSSLFVIEANDRISHFAFDDSRPPHNNEDFFNITLRVEPLTPSEIVLPALGVLVVCISMYLLVGLIAVYFKIFMTTSSKYVVGLLFFLVPLLVQSIFSVNTLRSLFVSSAMPSFGGIRESIGFGIGGLGQILVFVSLFESIGLSILLYLSTE
jgi:hypothetical protein